MKIYIAPLAEISAAHNIVRDRKLMKRKEFKGGFLLKGLDVGCQLQQCMKSVSQHGSSS
jgi:hypothetical protein